MALLPVEEARATHPGRRQAAGRRGRGAGGGARPRAGATGEGRARPAAFRCLRHGWLCGARQPICRRHRSRSRSSAFRRRASAIADGALRRGRADLHRRADAQGRRCRGHPGEYRGPVEALCLDREIRGTPGRTCAAPDWISRAARSLLARGTSSMPATSAWRPPPMPRASASGASPSWPSSRPVTNWCCPADSRGPTRSFRPTATRWPPWCGTSAATPVEPRHHCRQAQGHRTRHQARPRKADILLTTGGASVGDHDYVQEALNNSGVRIGFWKIAMRPGKPFMYGRREGPARAWACPAIRSRPWSAPGCS